VDDDWKEKFLIVMVLIGIAMMVLFVLVLRDGL
jgi:hypothetical protein